MSGRCFLFGALPVTRMPDAPDRGDYIIAADRGYDVAVSLGITPDLVVGDFDSRGSAPKVENLVRLPVRKDETDIAHALALAFDRGWRSFIVYGASGGKADHTFANIQLACDIARRGGRAIFYGETSFTVIRNASLTLPESSSGRVSVFSMTECSRGVVLRGLSYTMDGGTLSRYTPTGVSNAFIGKQAEISVRDGELLVMWQTGA